MLKTEECSCIPLLLRNVCCCCRAFLYPSDLQLELEYWAETGEYDAEELHEVRLEFGFY